MYAKWVLFRPNVCLMCFDTKLLSSTFYRIPIVAAVNFED